MWYWAWDFAKDGSLAGMDQEDIADAAMWDREPAELVEALVRCRWMDDADGLRLHDWDDYSGRQIKRLDEEAQRKRAQRKRPSRPDVDQTSAGRPQDIRRTSEDSPQDISRTSEPCTQDVLPMSCVTEHKQNITEQNINRTEQEGAEDLKPPAAAPRPDGPNPFVIYEQEGFGTLSPLIAEKLGDLIDDFGERWVIEALKAARIAGKRSIPYVTSILNRYRTEGVDEPWLVDRGRKPNRTKTGKPALAVVEGREDEGVSDEEMAEMLKTALRLDLGRDPTGEELAARMRQLGLEVPA